MADDDQLLIHPDRIDAKPLVLAGRFVPAELERLLDALADERGELDYRITARLDRQRRRVVSCIIEGFVFLTCQVTLEAFRHAISVDDRAHRVARRRVIRSGPRSSKPTLSYPSVQYPRKGEDYSYSYV